MRPVFKFVNGYWPSFVALIILSWIWTWLFQLCFIGPNPTFSNAQKIFPTYEKVLVTLEIGIFLATRWRHHNFLAISCNVPIPDILSKDDFLQNGTKVEYDSTLDTVDITTSAGALINCVFWICFSLIFIFFIIFRVDRTRSNLIILKIWWFIKWVIFFYFFFWPNRIWFRVGKFLSFLIGSFDRSDTNCWLDRFTSNLSYVESIGIHSIFINTASNSV